MVIMALVALAAGELGQMNKPVICAVNGICCGGGFELALSCDLILAAESASFALPEIRSGTVADAASIKLPNVSLIMWLWIYC